MPILGQDDRRCGGDIQRIDDADPTVSRGPGRTSRLNELAAIGDRPTRRASPAWCFVERTQTDASLALYAAMWASTAIWFAVIIRLERDAERLPASEIRRRGRRWLTAGCARHAATAGAWLLALAALEHRPAR